MLRVRTVFVGYYHHIENVHEFDLNCEVEGRASVLVVVEDRIFFGKQFSELVDVIVADGSGHFNEFDFGVHFAGA